MIDNVIDPPALTAAQLEALREQARLDARYEALRSRGILITHAGLTDTAGAAVYLGRGERTLERWRKEGTGPVATTTRGRCWYALSDLDAYLEDCRDKAG